MMFAAMTTFGAVRFGARAIADSISIRQLGNRPKWVLLGFAIAAIVWCSLHQDAPSLQTAFEISASCLAVAGAVITADFLTRRWRVERARRIDWVGALALLAGLAPPVCVPGWRVGPNNTWWHPWLLPSYGVGFLVCPSGRTIQKMLSVYNRETTTR
jgi:peptidoglycan/LPS O-acetylase OafA/YrhL